MPNVLLSVLAFDPGPTTGVCLAELWDGEETFRLLVSGTISWATRLETSRKLIEANPLAAIVVERFTLYKNKARDQIGNDFPSSQMIGTICAWAHLYGQEVTLYPASIMSRAEILPEHAPYIHKSEHARDAYKHARYHIEKTLNEQFVRSRR